MNSSENLGSSWSTRIIAAFSMRMISHSVMAVTVERRRDCPFDSPRQKIFLCMERNNRFLALTRKDGDFAFARSNIKYRIRWFGLVVDCLTISVLGDGPSALRL